MRAHLLPALTERIGDVDVVTDPDPDGIRSPLRTYLECLRLTPADATHRVVIQDDAWPCEGFHVKAVTALEERPDSLVCFFVPHSAGGGRNRMLRASAKGEQWTLIGGGGWIPTVATSWPTALIEPFIEFASHKRFARQRGDDPLVARFVRTRRLEVWATVPSLVDHPDVEPSLIGRPHGAGRIRWRTAAMFADT